ncbi:alpha/beta hydrolase, partial [Nocardioides sp.]|uniref:alpha/beta hydrolase n=1 Tax=Nocardioides sp. TaxID=35761 RepID=UPI0027323A4E
VHGFADYFFHTEYAEWWNARGYDFYALDLRKYGRSLRPHQTPNYVTDLRQHFPEIDETWRRITSRDGHDQVVASAHSTGGLTLSLWSHDRRPAQLTGLVLNSPWFDLQGAWWLRTPVGVTVLDELGRRQPRRVIPRSVSGLYTRSLHQEHEGEFAFNLDWKPVMSWPVHAGWLRAVRRGHAELHRGLDIACPALVLTSHASAQPTTMEEAVHRHDIVLDVAQIRRWSPFLGRHVTIVSIEGARHDVVLSVPEVRSTAYDELDRWHTAYLQHGDKHRSAR